MFIPHQANFKIMKQVVTELEIPISKVINTISFAGNTVNATLPYSYYHAKMNGKIKSGNKILFVTAGGGYSGGASIYIEP
jgi:3-oxoacyl-[acyl-carrier-protein] synthase-3